MKVGGLSTAGMVAVILGILVCIVIGFTMREKTYIGGKMNKLVDARGLSCPQPVMLAQKAIEEGVFPIEVLVDTVTSRENVRRMAEFRKCKWKSPGWG